MQYCSTHCAFCDFFNSSICSINTDYRNERSTFSASVVANVGKSSDTTKSHTVVVCDYHFDFAFVSSKQSFHGFLSDFCVPVTDLDFTYQFHSCTIVFCLRNRVLCTSDCFRVIRFTLEHYVLHNAVAIQVISRCFFHQACDDIALHFTSISSVCTDEECLVIGSDYFCVRFSIEEYCWDTSSSSFFDNATSSFCIYHVYSQNVNTFGDHNVQLVILCSLVIFTILHGNDCFAIQSCFQSISYCGDVCIIIFVDQYTNCWKFIRSCFFRYRCICTAAVCCCFGRRTARTTCCQTKHHYRCHKHCHYFFHNFTPPYSCRDNTTNDRFPPYLSSLYVITFPLKI